ncbi:MAG: class I SAM-dependent methyltransferase [Lentisphaerae bacterium]|nr:class I SAM-dependent methyltransferase [Lentisphaerota bacterium]
MDPDLYEHVCCGLCGADNPELLFGTHPIPGGKTGGVVRCRSCGLVYRNVRRKAAALRLYFEREGAAGLSADWIASRRKACAEYLALLEPFRRNNRILDVGAGHGFFLSLCAERGWDCHGVETAATQAAFARRHFGLTLTCGAFEEFECPEEHFDAVTFLNVLEFLPGPRQALRKTHRLLRPGGVVLVRFSNAAFHLAAYKFFTFLGRMHPRLNWAEQTVIHSSAFDRNSITRLFREIGFTDIKVALTALSWTTTSDRRIPGWQKIFSKLLGAFAYFFYLASFGNFLISPSLVAMARKN